MRSVDTILAANNAKTATELFQRFQNWKPMQAALGLNMEEVNAICEEVNRVAGKEAMAKLEADNHAKVKAKAQERYQAQRHVVVVGANGERGQKKTQELKAAGELVVGIDANASDDEWRRYLQFATEVYVCVPFEAIADVTEKIVRSRPALEPIYVAKEA